MVELRGSSQYESEYPTPVMKEKGGPTIRENTKRNSWANMVKASTHNNGGYALEYVAPLNMQD